MIQKKVSILHQNQNINTMTESAILVENFKEITIILEEVFSRQAKEKIEESLTPTETKILYLKIKK